MPDHHGRRRRGGLDWWCALPDTEAVAPAAFLLHSTGDVLTRHSSGRPWIIGSQHRNSVRTVQAGPVRAAVFGECLARASQLTEAIRGDLAALMALPGNFHVVLISPTGMVAAGDVAGFRRLFTTRVTDLPTVASHADVLRRLTDAPVSRVWLAARLTSPDMPSVLRERLSPFTGVEPIPPGCCVEITGSSQRMRRWWTPPTPDRPITKGADACREALTTAVTSRLERTDGPASVQLSGGLDSTTLACVAASNRPLLLTTAGRSPVNDDLRWAQQVAEHLPHSVHYVIDPDQAPAFFAELDQPMPGMDEPVPFAAGAARQRYAARLLAEHGVALHLNGQGGDEVLLAPLAYLRAAVQAEPRTGWRHLRGHAALKNTSVWAMTRAVLRRESFAAWLRRSTASLHTDVPPAVAATGWEAPPLLPPWASIETGEIIRSAILTTTPYPFSDDQTTHAAVVRIRASAYRAALYRDAMQSAGVATAMPFLDQAVVEACLAVYPWQRTDPWQPKPLIRTAFRGRIPERLSSRRTKGHYNADIYHGWTTHREQLAEFMQRPMLAERHGLIDPKALHRDITMFGPSGLPPAWLTEVLAIEQWLRDLTYDSPQEAAHAGHIASCSPRTSDDHTRPQNVHRSR